MLKFLIILKNMLESHAELRFVWDYNSKEYELAGLSMKVGQWHLNVNVDWPLTIIHLYETIDDRSWVSVNIDDIDNIIEGLSESYFDFLLEGIE